MKIARYMLAMFVVLAAFSSCKKEKTEEVKPYLSGKINFEFPPFVFYGDEYVIKVDGITRADGKDENIRYYVSHGLTGKKDTLAVGVHEYRVKIEKNLTTGTDTLGTFNVVGGAFATDGAYYSTSSERKYTIVKPGVDGTGSIKGFNTETPVETIGGKSYYVTNCNEDVWMRQNLAEVGTGIPYSQATRMSDIFGHYYSWNEAQTVCPAGWHLPSDAEFETLIAGHENVGALMADVFFNGLKDTDKVWVYWPGINQTDASQLSLLPTGYAVSSGDNAVFSGYGSYAVLWTSSSEDGLGVCRYVHEDCNTLFKGTFDKDNYRASVRCVKNK